MNGKSVAVLAAAAASASALLFLKNRKNNQIENPPSGSPRLPRSVIPLLYSLELRPNLETCQFEGTLDVKANVVQNTKFIVLNVADISLAEGSIWIKSNDTILKPCNISVNAIDELLFLEFPGNLPSGEIILHIEYEGTLNEQMKGLYRSEYEINGEKRNMAVTQFEAADARRCFPCWDEPAFKARFSLTVHAPTDRVVLSNMPVISESIDGDQKVIKFDTSPLMSTYLVALVIGEFEFVEDFTEKGLPVRVYTQPQNTQIAKFALSVALKTLPFFEKYFGASYPLPKLDMIAIPDFAAGAMENFGLITYRSAALLVDEVNSSATQKQRVAITVTHELAHQWFGNLVTMEWWTHLWLNEGFASWVSHLATDHLFPEWKVWNSFNISDMVTAFRLDALKESHPIEVEISHVKEIDEIFDAISYSKGACVIRMIQSFLGATVFQQGLCEYIQKYSFQNAHTVDLWVSLGQNAQLDFPVHEIMSSWTCQTGYPVISVYRNENNTLTIEQEQYLASGEKGEGRWILPLTYITNSSSDLHSSLIREKKGEIELQDPVSWESNSSDWVKFNANQAGFYRVKYEKCMLHPLIDAIAKKKLNAADRFGLLDDMYALCRARKEKFSSLLSLLKSFEGEEDYSVLHSLCDILVTICTILTKCFPNSISHFKKFASRLLNSQAQELGWENVSGESHLQMMKRSDVHETLVELNDEHAIKEGVRRYHAFMKDAQTNMLPADLRKAAYKAALSAEGSDDVSTFHSLLDIYRHAQLSEERMRVLVCIAHSSSPNVLIEALKFSLSSEVRSQDGVFVFYGIKDENRMVAWNWLKENWEVVYAHWGESFLFPRLINSIISQLSTNEAADDVDEFFANHPVPSIGKTVKQCIERTRTTARLLDEVRKETGLEQLVQNLAS